MLSADGLLDGFTNVSLLKISMVDFTKCSSVCCICTMQTVESGEQGMNVL